jgi:dTDP-4-dehydrorhamnose 3,5-epimerase
MISVIDLPIRDAKLIALKRNTDHRGWFTETFRDSWILDLDITDRFILEFWSFSKECSTIRGLHAQTTQAAQSKLVQVLNGSIQDILVDARLDSPTFGEHCEVILNSSDPCLIYVPKGCYHGFITLEDNTYVGYKVDQYHNAAAECGVMFDSPELNINWNIKKEPIISQRDQGHPSWSQAYKFEGLI